MTGQTGPTAVHGRGDPASGGPAHDPLDDDTGPLPVVSLPEQPQPQPAASPHAVEPSLGGVADAHDEPAAAGGEAAVAGEGAVRSVPATTGGRHAGQRRPRGRALLAAAGAVAAVSVGIAAMNMASAGSSGAPGEPTVGPATASSPAPATPSGEPAPSLRQPSESSALGPGSAAPGQPAPGQAAPDPVAPAPAPAAVGPAAPAAAAGPAPAGSVPAAPEAAAPAASGALPSVTVTVLNQTQVPGLGAAQAARLTRAGWHVRRVTDVRARLAQTTVYYDRGQQSAAQRLVATVPKVARALPRPRWLLPTGGLIVIVAGDAR